MRMRNVLLLAAAVLLLSGAALAKPQSVVLSSQQPTLDVRGDAGDGYTVNVNVGKLEFFDVETKAGTFTQLVIPGFHATQQVGDPRLPMMNRLVAVPMGSEAVVEVVSQQTRRIKLADLGVTNLLMPAQPSLSKSDDPALAPFHFNAAAYAESGLKAQAAPAAMVYQGRLRAVDFSRLEISPVSYDPVAGELEVAETMQVRVRFEGGDPAAAAELLARTWSPFFDAVYARIDGARGLHDSYPDLVRDEVTLVIITPSMFTAQLQDFIQWKTERGFRVITGEIGTPEVGSTTTSIQSYIHGLYNNGSPQQPAPSFVIFVGDVAQCPTWTISSNPTDRPYCAVDGDYVPDIYYGRLSATNTTQLQAILDKTMLYDTYSMPDDRYLANATLIAGVDSYWSVTHANGTIRYGEDYYFNNAHGINAYAYYYPASGSSAAAILNNCNTGIGFINYTAHGSTTSWSNPSMTQANVNSMTNNGRYFLAVGNCCQTSTYSIAECFGETFLRAPNKGAIGYIGGANNTYWDEDVYWSVGNLPSSSIRDGMTYAETGVGAYDGLFHDMPNEVNAPGRWYVTNDAIVFCGNLAVQESGSSLTQYYWNIYNLLGDPTLATYLGVPTANAVSHPANLVANMGAMTVQAAVGSYVGLTQNGALIGAGSVRYGMTQVTIDFLAPLASGAPVKMVVMAQNRVPYVVEIPVASPSVVTITPQTFPATVPTTVTVQVYENDGVTPIPGVTVQIQDSMTFGLEAVTNASGVAELDVDYPYGTMLWIGGSHPTEGFLFADELTVTALPLSSPAITVATEFGLVDVFAMNLESTITATSGTPDFTLMAYTNDLGFLWSSTGTIVYTPTVGGEVQTYILKAGYDIFRRDFPILTTGSVRGTAVLQGASNHAGITITATPGDVSTQTAADGSYLLTGLGAGTYTLTASKEGYSVESTQITLAEGQHLSGVNFSLSIVYEVTECVSPSLNIPDNNTNGVTSSVQISQTGEITSVRVYVNITHTYIGDLQVRLTAPSGTSILLHNRSGGSADDIVGWYPDDLTPANSLAAFLGEEMQGTWSLKVSDHASYDTGTLNQWCLNIGYAGNVVAVEDGLPQALALNRNFPNPFNPQTVIGFAVPQAGPVKLAVFDLRGRLVTTLVDEAMTAGHHQAVWRGQDDRGQQVASGTYFYRLTAGGQTITDKMLLLK
jgi:subtilisin-like proprotein convertase family protein